MTRPFTIAIRRDGVGPVIDYRLIPALAVDAISREIERQVIGVERFGDKYQCPAPTCNAGHPEIKLALPTCHAFVAHLLTCDAYLRAFIEEPIG